MIEFHLFHSSDSRRHEFDALFKQMNPGMPQAPLLGEENCLIGRRSGQVVAKASLQLVEDLAHAPGVTGLIGHYDAVDNEAGSALLKEACGRLSERGAARIVGPMNGSTWGGYRLALPGGESPFLGDVINPENYPAHFEQAGFSVVESYQSRVVDQLAHRSKMAEKIDKRFHRLGGKIVPMDMGSFERQLHEIYELSCLSFADNLYYRDIPFSLFEAMMTPMKPLLNPELILLAYQASGKLAAIIFAYPDTVDSKRVVLKSLATAPKARSLGLGLALIDRIHKAAYRLGYSSVIHALMHDDNVSLRLSKEYESHVIRRYALFQWK